MSPTQITIIPTTMRVAFEGAAVPSRRTRLVNSCLQALRKNVGLIRRRQLWNYQRASS